MAQENKQENKRAIFPTATMRKVSRVVCGFNGHQLFAPQSQMYQWPIMCARCGATLAEIREEK